MAPEKNVERSNWMMSGSTCDWAVNFRAVPSRPSYSLSGRITPIVQGSPMYARLCHKSLRAAFALDRREIQISRRQARQFRERTTV
jgi:hypothetical protein